MTQRISRRFFLGGVAASVGLGPALADAPLVSLRPQLRPRQKPVPGAQKLIADAGLPGMVAFAVADVKSGVGLESINAGAGLPPASVAKALTALYALDTLGADHRFETRVFAEGPVENGILQGDLVLAGGADPTLDTEGLARLAANLKAAGVREVRGAFKVYDGVLPRIHSIDPGQPDHLGYSPAISGIALNFNRVHFEWKRGTSGYSVTMDARTANYRPQVAMSRMTVVSRRMPVYTYEPAPGMDRWTVASGALGGGGARWLPVRKPALYAGDVFQTLARSQGIVLDKVQVVQTAPTGRVLARHASAPLRDIVRGMLKYSTNLTAEMVGMAASSGRIGTPASLAESAAEMCRWATDAYGMSSTLLVDHSGLGDASRMAPRDLVGALVQVRRAGILRPLLKPFAMPDASGRLVKAGPVAVAAKTGTLNFVSGLGGFVTASDGTELAFAIFTADMERRSRLKRSQRERPEGARAWNGQSRGLQRKLIERWAKVYAKGHKA
ncbi:D-alanyl-D-alanine carboxypeptidase/D-alanyl-D-alanine endopeptidase [Cribrihabitans marinus]|nr:D-alanyl-D-alanine carboxypeptidase/D-alanyl-D-alanine-endopeptidase [Cribrihabitans marinus]